MRIIRTSIILLVLLTAVTGVLYPFFVTVIAQVSFPYQASGSLLLVDGHAVASELIGQSFTDDKYFWSRPSATTPYPYNALSSGGSNLGPTNPELLSQVSARIKALQVNQEPVPVDLVTTSASGLDPHISVAAALYQAARVARARRLPKEKVREIIKSLARSPSFGLFGEPRVNVVKLNLALDGIK